MTSYERGPETERWYQASRLILALRLGFIALASLAGWQGHWTFVALSITLLVASEALRLAAVVVDEARSFGEPVQLVLRRRAARILRGLYLLWLAISTVLLVLVAIGGFQREDLVLLAGVLLALGVLFLMQCGAAARGVGGGLTSHQKAALAIAGSAILFGASAAAWLVFRPAGTSGFEREATRICETYAPRIAAATGPEVAFAERQHMRVELSSIAPPSDRFDRLVFANWLAALQAAEVAHATGDDARAARMDVIAGRGAVELGVGDACAAGPADGRESTAARSDEPRA
jgi:hypothetical protein